MEMNKGCCKLTNDKLRTSSQVFVVTEAIVVPVREIAVADNPYFSVHEILGVSPVEE